MKLDMDLIREILIWCEETLPSTSENYQTNELKFKNYTPEQISFHFHLLVGNGYINALNSSGGGNLYVYSLQHLTMDGYEFLDAIKSDTVWNGMKEEAGKIGIQAIKLAIPILTEIVKKKLLGLP